VQPAYLANLIDKRKVSSNVAHQQLGSLLSYLGGGQKECELEGLCQGRHLDSLAAPAWELEFQSVGLKIRERVSASALAEATRGQPLPGNLNFNLFD
jgi:hypothetical protein